MVEKDAASRVMMKMCVVRWCRSRTGESETLKCRVRSWKWFGGRCVTGAGRDKMHSRTPCTSMRANLEAELTRITIIQELDYQYHFDLLVELDN